MFYLSRQDVTIESEYFYTAIKLGALKKHTFFFNVKLQNLNNTCIFKYSSPTLPSNIIPVQKIEIPSNNLTWVKKKKNFRKKKPALELHSKFNTKYEI